MWLARRRHPVAGLLAALAVVAVAVVPAAMAVAAPGGVPDPLLSKQWGLDAVGATGAWATSTGAGVLIGVVDTGVDLAHQDLAGQVVASTDCVGSAGNPLACRGTGADDNGHGTEVAGVAAAVAGNGVGIAGVAPGARLVVAKALDRSGQASVEDVDAAIEWVVEHGARVVNLSLGDPTFTFSSLFGATLRQGVEYAWSKGAIPVLAAGNASALGLVAGYSGDLDAVVVGATGRTGTFTGSTAPTGDAKWAVMAPGGSADGVQADDILSTNWVAGQPNSYGYLSGTSMAAPFVSATLALLLSDGLSPQGAVDRLLATAVNPLACGSGSPSCQGIVDAAAAMSGLPPAPAPAVTTFAPAVEPSRTPPVAGPIPTQPRPAAPPVAAAAPAVMRPATPAAPAATTSTAVAAPAPPPNVVAGRVAVGLPATGGHHGSSSDVTWFVALAGVFAVLVLAGVLRVMRAPPPEGLE